MLAANKVGCRNLVNLTGPGIHIAYFSLLLRFYLCDPFSQRQARQQKRAPKKIFSSPEYHPLLLIYAFSSWVLRTQQIFRCLDLKDKHL